MAAASIAESKADVIVGVDTHKHSHFAKAKDQLGRDLDQLEIPTDTSGYADLLSWAQGLGRVIVFGVEGTSSYGAGLARFLIERNETVIEVLRPTKRDRRLNGKSDSVDADAAASAVLSGKARAIPKAGDQSVEMIRAIRIAKGDRDQSTNSGRERDQGHGGHRSGADPRSAEASHHRKAHGNVQSISSGPGVGSNHSDQTRVALDEPPVPGSAPRDPDAGEAAEQPHPACGAAADRAAGRGSGCRLRAATDCRQRRFPASLRGRVFNALWLLTDSSLFRAGPASSPQSRWRPSGQCRTSSRRDGPAQVPPADQGLHGQSAELKESRKLM